jgi:DNA mismatch endonuclease (patch repair protein)
MMASIRGKNTKPEMIVRRALHARGFRYTLHNRKLPGSPDLCFPKYRAVIFVHGCFWHGHGCKLFKWPKTRPQFWMLKINSNRRRDVAARKVLHAQGWRVTTIWECSLKGASPAAVDRIAGKVAHWLICGSRA